MAARQPDGTSGYTVSLRGMLRDIATSARRFALAVARDAPNG
jgi:hypothetical protein